MAASSDNNNFPNWPARAVVTAGMPYGNKTLHFGHIGGVFVPADAFARFLRDRIGQDNVCFVSGTDCYGSPIIEGYRKACESNEFSGTIGDYVMAHHEEQKSVLESFEVSLDIFEGSGIGQAGVIHQRVSDEIMRGLYSNGHLLRRSTLQFYDTEAQTFLNGRQVLGRRCPVAGCKAEHAYADECDLGHQYDPADLEDPVSTLTGQTPVMRPVENWYFDLPSFADFLSERLEDIESQPATRAVVCETMAEFLSPPIIYIKNEALDVYVALRDELPEHVFRAAESGKASFEIEFADIEDRDCARQVLSRAGVRFRTSKTLVPFRMTGNIEWGIKAPDLEGLNDLTVWCWPESLWAPISFTCAVMDARNRREGDFRKVREGASSLNWSDFWCSDDAQIYQFIGQDNVYFYGVVQPALWEALNPQGGAAAQVGDCANGADSNDGAALREGDTFHGSEALRQTTLIANHHLLFGKTKASSSGDIKPPTGEELLQHYTVDQLRAHFLALGLNQKSVAFCPKPFDPDPERRDDPRIADPVLKEGALLTNVFNRLARSCLYEAGKNFDTSMPLGEVTPQVCEYARKALADYDNLMYKVELHSVMTLVDDVIRWSQKYWADEIKVASDNDDMVQRRQVLLDSFYLLRVCTLLMHPIVPRGCELICDYMNFIPEEFFTWDFEFASNDELCAPDEIARGAHLVKELPARFDFFRKHDSQYK